MQLRKYISLLLVIFILFSNLGVAFNVHYCHDKIASVSLKYHAKESTDGCCKTIKISKKCCSEKVVKLEKKSENVLVKSFQLNLQNFIGNEIFTSIFPIEYQAIKNDNSAIFYYCNSNAPPIYKLNCQLVFYA